MLSLSSLPLYHSPSLSPSLYISLPLSPSLPLYISLSPSPLSLSLSLFACRHLFMYICIYLTTSLSFTHTLSRSSLSRCLHGLADVRFCILHAIWFKCACESCAFDTSVDFFLNKIISNSMIRHSTENVLYCVIFLIMNYTMSCHRDISGAFCPYFHTFDHFIFRYFAKVNHQCVHIFCRSHCKLSFHLEFGIPFSWYRHIVSLLNQITCGLSVSQRLPVSRICGWFVNNFSLSL